MALVPSTVNLREKISISTKARREGLSDKIDGIFKPNAPNSILDPFGTERRDLSARRESTTQIYAPTNVATNQQIISDSIVIIDIDAVGVDEGIRTIELPFIPKELSWNCESSFVAIKPIGRNNPKYHFTGSEDRVEFEIDWHSMDNDRMDVIRKCRLIEALSKGDGYKNPPHRVLLKWGTDDILFRDIIFIVTAAPYRLTQFNKAQLLNGTIQSNHLLPIQAYQKISLSRITDSNLSSTQIQLVAK